jgi:hypothetical protein
MRAHAPTVALLLATLVGLHEARAACKSTCSEELRVCGAACAPTRGAERHQCRQRCEDASTCSAPGARLRTTAYVAVECRQDASGTTLTEKLLVRGGNCDPVTVMELPPAGPVNDQFGLCRVLFGRFQRVGVTPNGRRVLFEVTNDHTPAALAFASPEPPEEGIFIARADGTGRRRLGDSTKRPIIEVVASPDGPAFQGIGNSTFAISPSGRYLAVEDYGPGPGGEQAGQIFVLDLKTGARTQVTQLTSEQPGAGPTCCARFVDDRTIIFHNGAEGARSRCGSMAGSPRGARPTASQSKAPWSVRSSVSQAPEIPLSSGFLRIRIP